MGKIVHAIVSGRALAFPNLIPHKQSFWLLPNKPPRHDCPCQVTINLPQDYSSCKVIDGQHRLLGFSKISDEIARSYNLPIVAFERLTEQEEIKTFITINTETEKS